MEIATVTGRVAGGVRDVAAAVGPVVAGRLVFHSAAHIGGEAEHPLQQRRLHPLAKSGHFPRP